MFKFHSFALEETSRIIWGGFFFFLHLAMARIMQSKLVVYHPSLKSPGIIKHKSVQELV